MKKIAIIGGGISGLFFANLFKENQDYKVTKVGQHMELIL